MKNGRHNTRNFENGADGEIKTETVAQWKKWLTRRWFTDNTEFEFERAMEEFGETPNAVKAIEQLRGEK